MSHAVYYQRLFHGSVPLVCAGLFVIIFGAHTTAVFATPNYQQHQHHSSLMLPAVDDIFPAAIYTIEPVSVHPTALPITSSSTSSSSSTDPTVALSSMPALVAPPLASGNFISEHYVKDIDMPSTSVQQPFSIYDGGYFTASPTTISSLAATSKYGDVFFSPAAAYANTLFFPSLASVMGTADASAIPFSPAFLQQPQPNTAPPPPHHYPPLFSPTTSSATLTFDPAAYRAYYDPAPASALIGQSNTFYSAEQRPISTSPHRITDLPPRPLPTSPHKSASQPLHQYTYPHLPPTYQYIAYDSLPDPHYWTSLPPTTATQTFTYPAVIGRQATPLDSIPLTQYYWPPSNRPGRFMRPVDSVLTTAADGTTNNNVVNRQAVPVSHSRTDPVVDYLSPLRGHSLNSINNAPQQQQPAEDNLFGRTGAHPAITASNGVPPLAPRFAMRQTSPVVDAFVKEGIAEALGLAVPPSEAVEVMFKSAKGIVLFGNELLPSQTNDEPPFIRWPNNHRTLYTLMMLDLDAPSTVNPYQRPLIQWIVVNIPGNLYWLGKTLVKFVGPNPLPGTGNHRYVFLVYEQPEYINADEPVIPRNEMTARMNFRLSDFVVKYNLIGPLAGNFFHSAHEKKLRSGNVSKFEGGNAGESNQSSAARGNPPTHPYYGSDSGGSVVIHFPPQHAEQVQQQHSRILESSQSGTDPRGGEISSSASGLNPPSAAPHADAGKHTTTDFYHDRALAGKGAGRPQKYGSPKDTKDPNYYYGRALKAKQEVQKKAWRFEVPPLVQNDSAQNSQPALQDSASVQEASLLKRWKASEGIPARRIPVIA